MGRRFYLCLLWIVALIMFSVLYFTKYKSSISNVYASGTVAFYPQDTTRILISTQKSQISNDSRINVNSAQVEDLLKLPGVGPVLADRIIKFRDENGLFKNIDELDKVKGIGPSKIERLRGKVSF